MSKSNTDQKGRSKKLKGRFARLDLELLYSPAYRSLGPNARALLIELTAMENGQNNGAIYLSEIDAAQRIGVTRKETARAAFGELVEAGFIRLTTKAHFNVKTGERRARCWRLTWIFNYAERKPASHEWRNSEPSNPHSSARAKNGKEALDRYRNNLPQKQNTGLLNRPMNDGAESIGLNNRPMNNPFGEKPPFSDMSIGLINRPHTAVTREDSITVQSEASERSFIALWQCESKHKLTALCIALASFGQPQSICKAA
jgi:hypothetical protein